MEEEPHGGYSEQMLDFLQRQRLSDGDSFEIRGEDVISNLREVEKEIEEGEDLTLYAVSTPPYHEKINSTFLVDDLNQLPDKLSNFDWDKLEGDRYSVGNGIELVDGGDYDSYAEAELPDDFESLELRSPTHSSQEENIANQLYGKDK